jgi:hypothetical protein
VSVSKWRLAELPNARSIKKATGCFARHAEISGTRDRSMRNRKTHADRQRAVTRKSQMRSE